MTIEDFQKVVEFSLASNEKQIRLLGGEPTLHPQFNQFLDLLSEHPVALYLMTNGVISKDKVDALLNFSKKNPVKFLCNVAFSEKDTSEMLSRRAYFFNVFQTWVIPSVTIYDYHFDISYIVDLIETYNLARKIRVGIAHPIVGCDNKFLDPKYFKAFNVSFNIERDKLLRKGITVNIDCGMVKCGVDVGTSFCNPIIDVGVDLNVWACFPLVNYKKVHLTEFNTLNDLENYFRSELIKYRGMSLFEECNECVSKKVCCGGCLAHRINL